MSATTGDAIPVPLAGEAPQLRRGALSIVESLGQSIANVAPTLTPAINISVVAGLAGAGSWVSYLISSIALLFVAASIGTLAGRHPQSGSYFVYIGRTLGPMTGALAGWSMIAAYLFTAVAVCVSFTIFLGNFLDALGLSSMNPPFWVGMLVFMGAIWFASYRDIKLSSRVGLVLEGISVTIILIIAALVVYRHGGVVDHTQLDFGGTVKWGGVMSALAFAVFSFVGFESSATLAKETANPTRTVPRAVMFSAIAVGIFFTVISYLMILGMDGDAKTLGDSGAPFTDLTKKVGIGWAAGVVYFSALISVYACGLASVNAASRMFFSMGRYKFLTRSMGTVHATHKTPHLAVTLAVGFTLLASLAVMLPLSALDAFGTTGTFATFGFLVVYLLICVVAPLDLKRSGEMKTRHVVIGVLGTAMMAFVMYGSLVPVPAYPYNILPYLFLAYMLVGAAWFGILKLRRPDVLVTIEHDMEEAA